MMQLRPLLPREHGSWAMLIVPLLLGLMVAPLWSGQVLVLMVAALGFFLVRHPLALLVKRRKQVRSNKRHLWQWAWIYGAITGISGGWLLLGARLWWLAPIGLFGGLLLLFHLWLITRRQEMSVIGELSGIVGLALGAPMAYYVASGQLSWTAAGLWVINVLYFGSTVFYIKLKARQQPRMAAPARATNRFWQARAGLAYQLGALLLIIVLSLMAQMPALVIVAFIPSTLKVVYGAWQWQDRASLSLVRLGVIEIIQAVIFAVLVVVAFD